MGTRARLATLMAGATAVFAASILPSQLACSRFSEPCRLAGEVTLYAGPSQDGASGALLEGPSGETMLRFITYPTLSADAGVEAGNDAETGVLAGFGTVGSGAAPVPTKVDIVLLPGPQGGSIRAAFEAPFELSRRVGSTADIGVTYTGQGVLFTWTEQTTRMDPDGKVHGGARLRYAYSTGADAPPTQDVVSCDDCTVQSAPVATKTTTFLFYAVTQQGKAATSSVLRLSPSGTPLGTSVVPRSLAAAGTVPRVFTSNGALIVRLAGGSYVVRDDLALSAGPFVEAGSSLSFVAGDGDPYAAWLQIPGSTSGTDSGASALSDQGFDNAGDVGQDLMLASFSPGGRVTRVTTASSILGVARDGDSFGVAFAGGDRDYFALAGADGQKIGGDVDIGSALSATLGAQGSRRVLRSSRAPHTFSVLELSGARLVSREVSCE